MTVKPEESGIPIDWFGAGWSVFCGTTDDVFFPPLNDIEAQRAWLMGFGAAWCEYPDNPTLHSTLFDDAPRDTPVVEALARALEGRAELLRQLRSHGGGRSTWTIH